MSEIGDLQRREVSTVETKLTATVLKDFYLSFRFSQGEHRVQHLLFGHLNNYYRTALPAGEVDIFEGIIASKSLEKRVSKLAVPSRHASVDESSRWSVFSAMLKKYQECVSTEVPHSLSLADLGEIATTTARNDTGYQGGAVAQRPNPNGVEGFDPHASYFREFILRLTPAGSDAYDDLFKATHAELLPVAAGSDLAEQLEYLVPEWEKNHPGISFFEAETLNSIDPQLG